MIVGVGTDIVSVERIKSSYKKFGQKFVKRILTVSEQEIFSSKKTTSDKISYLAKRFAAKEAVSKSLGCGIGEKISFLDIEISNDKLGKPVVKVKKYKTIKFHLSLSDEKEKFAIAYAVAEK